MSESAQISDFRALLNTLSPDALTRGKQFERVVKWWLENDPRQARQIEKVWLWDDWSDYPGRDIGIDLVARLLDGSLMAVQAKCVDESRSIPKSELDSFVSAASSSVFKHRMLVATKEEVDPLAIKTTNYVKPLLRLNCEAIRPIEPLTSCMPCKRSAN